VTHTYTDDTLGTPLLAADDMIVRWLRDTGDRFEPTTTLWMLDQLQRREGAFVDVGASTGWFAVPFAARGFRVIAFECNRRSIQRLKDNCALNGVEIVLHEAAASASRGEAVFRHNGRLPLTSGGSLEPVSANVVAEMVPCVALDDVIDEPVSVLKVDVEGHEMAVLAGAARVVARSRPALVLEANTDAHLKPLAAWCAVNDYTWARADTRNMLCLPRS
jgi:FkbM family methyltransferase